MTELPEQERLFETGNPARISPPEPGLYLGTSGWSYSDWEGTVYPPNTPARGRLAGYVERFASVEIDSTFYGTPRKSTVERWREVAPEGFLFAAKFPQEITHEKSLVNCERETQAFVNTMSSLGDNLGPLLLQLPPSFAAREMDTLDKFLDGLPENFSYAVEMRHRSWFDSGLAGMLRGHEVALTLVDYPGTPRLEEATAGFSYVRWLGDRREFPSGHFGPKKDRTEDLRWWSRLVDRFLKEGRKVFLYANNHYQNHAPSTVEQFLELRRER